jgi:hypothetical protein
MALLLGSCALIEDEPEAARPSGLDLSVDEAADGLDPSVDEAADPVGSTVPPAADPAAAARWQFVATANQICDEALADAVAGLGTMPTDQAGITRYLTDMLSRSQAMIDQLRALTPPPGDEALVDGILDQQDDLLARLRAVLETGRITDEAAMAEVRPIEQAADAALRDYGLTACLD